jgi:thiol-disulfide isomerase/thioredoxin
VTHDSILKVTLDGIPGTAMPGSRAALAAADIDPLVQHVYRLAMTQPPTSHPPALEERLLGDSGFVDLRGTEPPPLKAADAAGRVLKLSELKGQLVLVNFWGTGCIHCLKEMVKLREVEAALAGRPLTVLYICADADDAAAAQLLADHAAPGVRTFVDHTGVGLARFEVQTLPTVWLIGPDGKAIGRAHGARDWHAPALRHLIEDWLPSVPSPQIPGDRE